MTILITGGTGFIGSHTVVFLLKSGFNTVILDNLCNSSASILPRLEKITGKSVPFYQRDIRNREVLRQIFAEHDIDAVIHFAGLKAVGESVAEPMKYHDNNVSGSLVLAEEMARAGVLCSAHRLRFTAIRVKCLIQKICNRGIRPALTVRLSLWWSAF